MQPTYFAQYRGFEFQCSPHRLGDRAYAPRLVILDIGHSSTLEIPIAMPTPLLETPTSAAHVAFAHGRRWVDAGASAFGLLDESASSHPTALPGAGPTLSEP